MAMRARRPAPFGEIADYADLVVMPTCGLDCLLGKGICV